MRHRLPSGARPGAGGSRCSDDGSASARKPAAPPPMHGTPADRGRRARHGYDGGAEQQRDVGGRRRPECRTLRDRRYRCGGAAWRPDGTSAMEGIGLPLVPERVLSYISRECGPGTVKPRTGRPARRPRSIGTISRLMRGRRGRRNGMASSKSFRRRNQAGESIRSTLAPRLGRQSWLHRPAGVAAVADRRDRRTGSDRSTAAVRAAALAVHSPPHHPRLLLCGGPGIGALWPGAGSIPPAAVQIDRAPDARQAEPLAAAIALDARDRTPNAEIRSVGRCQRLGEDAAGCLGRDR